MVTTNVACEQWGALGLTGVYHCWLAGPNGANVREWNSDNQCIYRTVPVAAGTFCGHCAKLDGSSDSTACISYQ